jgi:hypothetical protein
MLILSGTMAHALEDRLARTLHEPPPPMAVATAATSDANCDARGGAAEGVDQVVERPSTPQAKDCLLATAQPGARWLTLGSVESDGTIMSLSCLARPERVVGDVLFFPAEHMDAVVAEVCLKTWL